MTRPALPWADFSHVITNDNQKQMLQNLLAQRILFLSDNSDKVFWAPSKQGVFSVKNGYASLQHNQRAFKFCWNNKSCLK